MGLFNPLYKPEPAWRFKTELLQEGQTKHVGRSPNSKIRLDPYSGYAALKAVELPEESLAGKLLKELRQFAIYSPDTATLRGLNTDPQSREPVGLSGGRLAEAVRDVLMQIPHAEQAEFRESALNLIDWANGLGAIKTDEVPVSRNISQPIRILRFRDRFMADGRNILSGYDASEGAVCPRTMFHDQCLLSPFSLLLVHPRLQFLPCFEKRQLFGFDWHLLPGFRIYANIAFVFLDRKTAQPPYFHSVSTDKGICHVINKQVNDF